MISNREILGIYLGDNEIDFFFLVKQAGTWKKKALSYYSPPPGKTYSERLYNLLAQIAPQKNRRICIGIPRSRYYLRELKFPGLSIEEAENAAKLAIGIHSHLPPEEIIFDCWGFEKGSDTYVLLAYLRKSYVNSIIDQLEKTNHLPNLFAISPVGLGVDIFVRKNPGLSFPALSIHVEDGKPVVNIHGKEVWEGSHFLDTVEQYIELSLQDYSHLVTLGKVSKDPLPDKPKVNPCIGSNIDICRQGKASLGAVTATVGTESYPRVSFLPGKRRKPFFSRIKKFQLVMALMLTCILAITGWKFYQNLALGAKIHENQTILDQLHKKFEPLRAKEEELTHLVALEQDILDFLHERPPFLDILRELAIRTPKEAWIKYLTLRNDKLRVAAEGGYAVRTMDSWRKSPIFKYVKLASPVTKGRDGQERYTVEILLVEKNKKTKKKP